MPSLATTLTAILTLTSSFSTLSPILPVSAASAAVNHPHGFHAPPYIASSLANASAKKRSSLGSGSGSIGSRGNGHGANHVKKGLAKKFRSREAPQVQLQAQEPRKERMEARAGERGLKRMEAERVELVERDDGYYGDIYGFSAPAAINRKRATVQIPTGWSYSGCVNESSDVRLLANGFSYSSNQAMSPLKCLTICEGFGYKYAGMEYANECYCANALAGNGGVVQLDSQCSMPCTGDSSAMCGAAWRLSLYTFDAADSVACQTIPSTNSTANSTTTATGTVSPHVTGTATSRATSTSTSTAANATITVAPNSTETSEWYSLGCAVDDSYSSARIMSFTISLDDTSITIDECLAECEAVGYGYAGLENGNQCFCASTLPSTISYVADSECASPCTGDSSENCGGAYRMDVYELYETSEDCTSSSSVVPTTTMSLLGGVLLATGGATGGLSASIVVPTLTHVAASSTSTSAPVPTPTVPTSSGAHAVYAHFMVGNSYGYDVSRWATDIAYAQGAGIDGFALNMGSSDWQPARVSDAYTAAAAAGFDLFLSLDMSSLSCGSQSDLQNVISIVTAHAGSSAQAKYEGRVLVSTFSGENCYFGKGSVSDAWQAFVTGVKNAGVNPYFVPSIFSDISTFSSNAWMDGEFNWNSGWPTGGSDLTTASDASYIDALDGKTYMAAISHNFFTHFGPDTYNKNWIYRGDGWLYCTRWEQMISMRDQVNLVEILTVNDWGESNAILPTDTNVNNMPPGSANWQMEHTAILTLTAYYAQAFKSGVYPTITADKIWIAARPHAASATAWGDSVSRPTGWQNTQDNFYVTVHLTAAATVTLTAGSNSQTFSGSAGRNQFSLAMQAGSGMTAKVTRNGQTTASITPSGFTFTNNPQYYNFNYGIWSS